MKRIHLLYLATAALTMFCGSHSALANTYYISPTGNDNTGSGTLASPWYSLKKVWENIPTTPAAHTVYLRGGATPYYFTETQYLTGKSGVDENNMIKVMPYGTEKPVIRPNTSYYPSTTFRKGIQITGNYILIKGLEITGFYQPNSTDGNNNFFYGILAYDSNYCTFENLKVHDNGFGLSIGNNSGDNLVLNSDFYRNSDPYTNFSGNIPWGGADGITIRTSDATRTNTIRGCRMWWNSDDGVDLYSNQGMIIIENSWAFWNGYQPGSRTALAGDGNGFKLGPNFVDATNTLKRQLRRNVAFENRARGWDQNDLRAATFLYNNTAYKNGTPSAPARSFDFWNGYAYSFAKNNLEFASTMGVAFNANTSVTFNSFRKDGTPNYSDSNGDGNYVVTANDFLSLDSTGSDGPRQADGSMPNLNFLKLNPTSDLVNCGTNSSLYGITYTGPAPDLGAFETTSTAPCTPEPGQ